MGKAAHARLIGARGLAAASRPRATLRKLALLLLLSLSPIAFVGSSACNTFKELEDCKTDSDCEPRTQRCNPEHHFCEVDKTPIAVGVELSLTGALAAVTANLRQGVETATKQINDAGGLLGRPIQLVVMDDQNSDDLAEKNARDLVAAGVVGIIGAARSSTTLRVAAPARDAQVVVITPFSGSTALAESQPELDRYLFQTVTSIRRGSALTMSVFGRGYPTTPLGCKNVVIVRTAEQVAPGYREAIAEYFPKLGGCVVGNVELDTAPKEEAAYDPEAQKLVDLRPDCAALATTAIVGARFIRSVKRLDTAQKKLRPDFFFLGQTAIHTEEFLVEMRVDPERQAPTLAVGVIGADIDTNPDTKEAKEFRALFNTSFDRPELTQAPIWAANGYDAMAVLALAIERAGSVRDRVRLRDAIFEVANDGPEKEAFGPARLLDAFQAIRRGDGVNYTGAAGSVEIDPFGVVTNRTLIWRVNDKGEFEDIKKYSEDETQTSLAKGPGAPACK